MKKLFWLLALLTIIGFAQPAAATCYTGGTWTFSYCQNITVYNNDTLYQLEKNSTVVLPRFNGAALIAAGKMQTSGADLILAYGKQELARFNGTDWNNDTVPIFFNTPVAIPKSGSDSNYALYYGDAAAVLSSRDYNASHVGWFGDDFLGTTVNVTGQWGYTTGTGGQVKVTCYRSTCNFDDIGNSTNYNLIGWNNTGFFTQTNASVWFRQKYAGGSGLSPSQFIAGSCDQTDTVQCGALGSPSYGFKVAAGSNGKLYFGQNSNTFDYDPAADNIYQYLKIHFEPTASRQQFWRDFDQINKGNTTIAWTNGWYTAFGNDGSGSQTNFTLDWVVVGKESVVNQPSLQTATEQTNVFQVIQIYDPITATYYNTTNKQVIWSLNSTTNATSMAVNVNNSGTMSFLGFVTNGTTNTTNVTVTSKSQLLTILAYDGVANRTGAVSYVIYNGLNLTVYNSTQATSTYLTGWTYNISNSTNQTVASATSPQAVETRSIPNGGLVTIAILKSGYASANLTNFVNSNSSAFYAFNIPLWRHQEFHLDSGNGTNVTSFNLKIYSGGLNNTYGTTNGTIQVSLGSLPFGNVVAQFIATGFNATNQTFNINSSSEINFTATTLRSGLLIYAFDELSCSISCLRINFSFSDTNGTNTGFDYNKNYFWNGTYTNSSLVQGSATFTFNNTADAAYWQRQYMLSISSTTAITLNVYLVNTSSVSAVYSTLEFISSGLNQPISGASVTVYKLIGGSYVTVTQGTTSSAGIINDYFDRFGTYLVTATATGFSPLSVSFSPVAGTTYFTMFPTTSAPLFNNIYADVNDTVISELQPLGALVGNWTIVNFSVASVNSTLTSWGMTCNYNNTIIFTDTQVESPAGGVSITNVTLTNKTNPTYFNCTGFFNRNGYPTAYVFRQWQIYNVNFSFNPTSISNAIYKTTSAQISVYLKAIISIILTAAGAALVAGANPVGGGVVGMFLMVIFMFSGWIPFLPALAILMITGAWVITQVR